jgi:SAM-dependent methyltransferase
MIRKGSLISWVRKIIQQRKEFPNPMKGILSAENNMIIKAFVQNQIENPNTFNSHISENDEMYLFALQHFKGDIDRACIELLTTGKQSMDIMRQIAQWNFDGFANIAAMLDFAGGYGRLTRFLIQELLPQHIWVCDIYEDAVKFQQKQFGVHGIVSVRDPEDFESNKKYDCIFIASLFSHLPEREFIDWLKCLYNLLTPEGLLIFSVHDVGVLPPGLKMEEKGILFIPESESRSLDMSDYGTTYVTESFVGTVIREITGEPRYYRKKRGLWWFQDVYIIAKNPNTNFRDLDLSPGPPGYVDRCILTDENQILFEGWAADFSRDTFVKDIQIIVDGKLLKRCLPTDERPDIAAAFQDEKGLMSGFSCSIPRSIVRPSDIGIVKVTNSRNIEHVIRMGTLESMVS